MHAGFAIWIVNLLHAQVAELVGEYPAVRNAKAGDLPVQPDDLREVLAHLLAQRGEHASRLNGNRLRLGPSFAPGNKKQSPAATLGRPGTCTAPPVLLRGVTTCRTGPPGERSKREPAPANSGLLPNPATSCSPSRRVRTTSAVPPRSGAPPCAAVAGSPSHNASSKWQRRQSSAPNCS